ncbi:biotin--[acetyl-CoA-carboxylase] ligase [Thermosynechococcaceae cyanobacterium BACA0444]|uniref:biotin--[biotin carboxyl-carrier protein] ligase n=1 Tax=Pseudocalidococcus azoricus BACA0444 TaxID=2918990 RepID=A0AAE4JZE7_9CYAN|nr:biotin--[acetyl-CoA-carboxylase] ligase [Pseudocalidococcus azoricus]MDS3860727.1 biotin--[acetyl-CoA-carboxylase] ligase [Pseudocalidococcus azoricus BACA0444]
MDWLWELPECPSTNTWAKKNSAWLEHGQAVFTQQQTAGRGQWGRAWLAPAGVLTVSFVLDVPGVVRPGFTLGVGLGVIYAVEALCPIQPGVVGLKWPNDLYANNRKLGGILCETMPLNPGTRVIVGIGLNRAVDLTQAPQLSQAISLSEISQTVPGPYELLAKMRFYLLQAHSVMTNQGLTPLLPDLNRYHILQGQQILIQREQEIVKGRVTGINASGQLGLRLASGETITIAQGQITEWD